MRALASTETGFLLPNLVRRILAGVAVLGAVAAHVALQWGYLWQRPDFSWSSFRSYFPGDQLSYMSMVTNAADGRLANVEPFTNTGNNTYPHLYYYVIGTVSRWVGLNPLEAWSVGGFIVQMVLVASIATAIYFVTRRWWMPVLAPVPFIIGAFATQLSNGGWYTSISSHAVLWGPFAVYYTLNGETVALSLCAVGLLLALATYLRVTTRTRQTVLYCVSAAFIGLSANVQTYGFLVGVYLALFVIAAAALVYARRWLLVVVSLALIVVVALAGPFVAGHFGPLAALAFGVLPAAPGLIVLIVRFRLRAALPLIVLVAAASPQLIATVLGIVSKDPFLSYRVASSKDLGVDWRGIVAAGAVLLPLLGILAAGIHRRVTLWMAFPIAAIAAWALTATNDLWGANQEPYRFWLDMFCLVSFVTVPVAAMVAVSYLRWPHRPDPAVADSRAVRTRRSAVSVVISLVVVLLCAVVAVVSLSDFRTFRNDYPLHAFLDYSTPRFAAIGELGKEVPKTGAGLLNSDSCIDMAGLKIVSDGAPVATFNGGMAWPINKDAVERVSDERLSGFQIATDAKEADVQWVMTDSACQPVDWGVEYADELSFVDSRSYPVSGRTATITLWKFTG
ncbi:hypothetical protein [Subtercola lobariae]|uniref:Uncharacterized protein n=1 Tax=Subtercola lobariae TaxID=1588641 RepID=A0A917EW48_9MICO|nr:hypothetical protein [Subtercola lobariae]GGF20534.1 hypothetical protein GCM10011399_12700 [Subtercola lobariae]